MVVGLGDYVFNHTDKNILNAFCQKPFVDSTEYTALISASEDLLTNAVHGYTAQLSAQNAANEQQQNSLPKNEVILENDAPQKQQESNPMINA